MGSIRDTFLFTASLTGEEGRNKIFDEDLPKFEHEKKTRQEQTSTLNSRTFPKKEYFWIRYKKSIRQQGSRGWKDRRGRKSRKGYSKKGRKGRM